MKNSTQKSGKAVKKDRGRKPFVEFLAASPLVRFALLAAVLTIFSVILYPNLILPEHEYRLGDVAERDIKAPRDFFIQDREATEENMRQAVADVLTVYDYDDALHKEIAQRVKEAFGEVRAVFEADAGPSSAPDADQAGDPAASAGGAATSVHDRVWEMKEDFEKKLGISVSSGAYKILEKEEFSPAISDAVTRIVTEIMENGVTANKEILLREADKGVSLRSVQKKTAVVEKNLRKFYGLDQAKTMVRVVGQPVLKDFNYTLVSLIVDFSQRLIQPNITLNRSETEERKNAAAEEVKPTLYQIKAGEMLLREGERANKVHILKLKTLQAQRKKEKVFAKSVGAVIMVCCLMVVAYVLKNASASFGRAHHNKDWLFLSVMLAAFFLAPKISGVLFESLTHDAPFDISVQSMTYGIPLAASAMTVCLFMGLDMAVIFALIVSICTAVIFQNQFEVFIYFLINCIMGAYWMQNCKERKVFIKAGVKLGFLNMILATAVNVYLGDFSGMKTFWDWGFAFIGGLGSGIVTAGLAPLLEIAFNYTTDIKLMELANLEQPILRRLMIEAPGTYHHSVVVGSMVEAAAAEIGANPLLAKVCGYYHDIGKINKPLYFVENQTDGKNRHDKLAPSMSSLILISHVKEGVEMSRKYKLGGVISDTIRQHHGTSLIKYFYDKARQIKGDDAVKIDDFRYPGPRPQTREAGLVMLADVVEAASRTLENPTPSRIQGLVQNLINKIFSDGQLDNCELTLKDLHNIAKSFNKILNGIHHHRIEYPEKAGPGNGKEKKEKKEKNGRSDSQQPKQEKSKPKKDQDDGSGHLKRLGVS